MIITFWKGVFVADSKPEDRVTLEKVGFRLHEPTLCSEPHRCKACRARIGRRYWSPRIEDATRLKPYCNERALKMMKEHLAKLARSRAVDADIEIPSPEGLTYLPYQKAGIAYALQHKDTLFGDEPGLGKTVESLGFINVLKAKNILVIAPSTLAFNWRLEAKKWLMEWKEIYIPRSTKDEVPNVDNLFVITNYEKVTNANSPLVRSLDRVWDVLICDEAHALKNPDAKRTQAVLGQAGLVQQARRFLALTGTPIENYPKEIWTLAATICPAKFGDRWDFMRRYCGLHQEEYGGEAHWVDTGHSHLAELQQRLRAAFMVRRLKVDVLKELPPKRRQLIVLGDSEVDWSKHPAFKKWKDLYERDYEARLAAVEAARTKEEYQKAVRALEAFTGVAFTEMSEMRHMTALAKLPLCIKYIDDLLEAGLNKLVIFAHHQDVLAKLSEHYGEQAVSLHGGTKMADREKVVREFQSGSTKKIFIGGLKAAGSGINLFAASTVVFVEIDWNPAVLSQAEDRLCRIGQKNMVHVIHLVLDGTLDANISQRVIEKQNVVDKALDYLPEKLRAAL